MGNEGSYGGYIVVRKNGSVVWQIEPRDFPKDRDTDGTLDYAIRVATSERNAFASRDGKCLVTLNVGGSSLNIAGPGTDRAKFLIVSGYETPDTPYDSVVVGKSYFVTGARYEEVSLSGSPEVVAGAARGATSAADSDLETEKTTGQHDHGDHKDGSIPFTYDLSLRYDDYDLERAGLPADLDVDELEVCYQNSISLKEVYDLYNDRSPELLRQFRGATGAKEQRISAIAKAFQMTDEMLKSVIVWTLTYRHLRALGIARDLIDDLENLVYAQGDADGSVWFSRWQTVGIRAGNGEGSSGIADDLGTSKSATNPRTHETDAHLGSHGRALEDEVGFRITAEDLESVPGSPVIEADKPVSVSGSRTITLRNLRHQGTFVLMYHGNRARDNHEGSEDWVA